ncbi:Maf family nucleotide pyrophosphatase [Aureitalea marina]|uniref:dTTP/UTP pyrophosphatase n=1 Tax=Aureitalea marina TaxID=930804 RepID=A0A2S7KPM6_9FLAO|nr:Maf family nucleotide pyrophosphatase [Aureitalea marina]PQB04523.1 septum formation protein Maf [Aureitalea marina]
MLNQLLGDREVILASGSPRRVELLSGLLSNFRQEVRPVEEVYDPSLKGHQITDYLAQLKADAFHDISSKQIVITSDTIVWHQGKALEKPADHGDAFRMIKSLSNEMHEVFTSVCFKNIDQQITFYDSTRVWFEELTDQEIDFYIDNFKPFDKAGAYGVQDWLGYAGIHRLEGSYFTVMGFPTHLVYKNLKALLGSK